MTKKLKEVKPEVINSDELLDIIRSKTDSVGQVVAESMSRLSIELQQEMLDLRAQIAELTILLKTQLIKDQKPGITVSSDQVKQFPPIENKQEGV
jgi:hypothetical protein